MAKNLPAMQGTLGPWVKETLWSLGQEDPLEEGMATHSTVLAWRIPWTEEPGGLQSMGLQRVGHNWATNTSTSKGIRMQKESPSFPCPHTEGVGRANAQTCWMKSVAASAGWSPELTEPVGGVTDETGPERIPWDVMATLSPGSQPVESPGPENIFNQKAIVDWINPYETAVWLLVLYKQVRCCDNALPLAADPTPQDHLLSRLTLRLDVSSPPPGPPPCIVTFSLCSQRTHHRFLSLAPGLTQSSPERDPQGSTSGEMSHSEDSWWNLASGSQQHTLIYS